MSNVIPCLPYADPRAAIDWLGRAFGFTPLYVDEKPDGSVGHVELTYGGGVLMFCTGVGDPLGVRTPRAVGALTQALYVLVDDVDAHHARAVDAGAEIVMPLTNTDYGSRDYAARDPDGHVWSFGTYRPNVG
jgi:uncharacterized glyoxalase superfamily protein PhnB